ncbi:HTH-type transcriptional regulator DegA [Clostridium pasteurianum DSM 525 = ATCC 6013]|uniref:HTH-type transcriptional regulator DegA n=2 Tax=Clostridium pasteurianum TaxID=1501 RepID=A0A0H3J6G5_CLOPA|nr:LacI family DNA-binding transcriptional regulator [Clostridium pasteurianum]AJA48777.1 HTH-type transcriptional regulator DegA [Clostridium pasteurianum DSM 525 = ATCC 6013]AJA52765.1 HTH-type transcriptional regulator DegA [Clostridium pasteurianum DSM 525 = ATCC 6013]AOZ75998.1 LacI family transcriptional regulator [Clostridium pasteurianum DSM 525 = ATCC 6013]AOZ79794.1 LacI family transcriptional regulator [Clostridium pasteurianum]ELP60075.1 LacI family transcriptional regulator [Clost
MNIYDIAKEAGVSITTVSRVLNNKENISKKTKEKVQSILNKYNYTPNAIARGLVAKSMKSIGVVTTDITDIHHGNTAYIIEREFNKIGYNVILCNTGGKTMESINYIKMLSERNIDGIILMGSVFNDDDIKSSMASYINNIPMVIINGFLNIENTHSILVDDAYGISLCVDHLINSGHRDIVYVKDQNTYSANQKKEGFIMGMNKNNLSIDDNSIINVKKGLEGGADAVEKLIQLNKKFSAIIFGEDITAIGGIKKLRSLGLHIPKDVAITGFNNSIFARCCYPELTSVDNKVETTSSLSVKLLTDLIEKKNVASNILVRPDLVIRESS